MSIRVLLRAVLLRAVVVLAVAAASSPAFCATVTWDAGAGNNLWSNATNWSTDSLPTSSDDVVINNATSFDTVFLDQNATVQSINIGNGVTIDVQAGWVLTVDGPSMSTVDLGGTVVLDGAMPTGGSFSGNGALTVDGTFRVHGNCTLAGSGALTINSGGELHVGTAGASNVMSISRNTTNNTGGKIIFLSTSVGDTNFNATITNTGIIDIQNDEDIGGTATINNNSGGVVTKSAGGGISPINFTVNNAAGATIQVQTGNLALNGGGTVSGAYSMSASTFLHLGAGTFTMSGSPTVTGAGRFSMVGATLVAGAGVDVTLPDVDLFSGTITGAGAVRVSGDFDWFGGTIAGSGTRVLNSTSTPTINCSADNCLLDGAALQLQSSATFSATTNALVFSNGASLTIDPGKTLVITSSGDFSSGGGATSSIVNNGTIWKQTFGLSIVGVPVTLSGTSTVDIDDGPMQFAGGASVDAGATLDITVGEALDITGGVFLFNTGNFTVASGEVRASAGTLRISTGATLTMPFVTLLAGGVIDGGGTVIISGSGTINWNGGTMGSAAAPGGITQINSGATMFIGGSGAKSLTQTRQLLNNGTVSYGSAGAAALTMSGNSKITNNSTLNLTGNGAINVSGSALIENYGTLTKTVGAGTSTLFPRVENNNGATVSASAGTIVLSGGGIAAGAYAISSGRTLILDAGTFTVDSTATVTGAGTFSIAGATLDAGVGVNLTCPNVTLSAGTITGAGAVGVSGNFTWSGGTIAGSGTRELQSTSTPAISCSTGPCNLDTAALQMNASATFNATSNSLIFANAASLVIASGKTLDITTDGTIVGTAVGVGTITNNGTITKSGGPGLRSISTVLNNNGSVIITAGGLSLLANGTHSGLFTTTAPGTIAFDGGAHTLAGGISGTGTLAINGATVTLNSAGNAGGFTMSGGTLGGSGTLTLANGGTWSGGTMSGSGTTAVAAGKTLTVSGSSTLNGRALDLGAGAMLDLTNQMLDFSSAASVTGTGTVRVNGGTMRVLSGVTQTFPKLTLTTGVIDGAGALHVSGNFNWLGGTIEGSGARVLDSSSTPAISCSSADCLLDGATLQLQASATTYSASSNALVLSNGASLILDAGKGLDVINDGDFLNGGGAASSIVIGGPVMGFNALIRKWMTSGTSIIGVPVTMSGSFLVETGTLEVAAGVSIAAGAIIDYRPGAAIEVTGGVFLFNSSSVSFPFNGDFKVSGGTLRVPTGVTLTMPNVTLEGSGVIDGGGTLTLTGNFNWRGGTIAGSGPKVLNSTSTPAISCSTGNCLLDGATLQLQAWGTYSASSNALVLANGASLILDPGKVLFVTNDGDFLSGGGAVSSITVGGFASGANGCIQKTTTAGTSIIAVPVTLSGSFMTVTGTLQAGAGVTVTGPDAIVHYDPGTTIEVTGGVFLFTSGTVFFPNNGDFKVSAGTLRVQTGVTMNNPMPNVTLEGSGVIDGGGTLTLSGNFNWSGGTITGSGPKVLNSTSAPAISCSTGNCLLDGATLQFQAGGTYSASTNALVLSNGASLILDPGKILFVTNDGDFLSGGGAASSITVGGFASGANGCIEKTTTSGTSIIGVPVMLSGSFKVDTGTLQAGAGVTVAAGANVHYAGGATIEVTGGVFLFTSGIVTITQPGDFKVSGGTLRVPTGVTITMLNVTLEGSGVIDGGGTLNLSGTSTWSAGTMSGSGTTVIPATMSLGISAPVTLSRTLQNYGTLNVSGDITGSGTIDNGGTLNALADLTIGVVLNNSGQVVTSNTISLAGGGTHTGSFNVTTPGGLFFSSGTHSMSGGSIGGTGTLVISGATVTVGSPLTIGTLNITAGTATLDANGSTNTLIMSGGTLGGSGTLTLGNGGTWSGGTMSGSGTTINPATMSLGISAPVTLSSRTLQNDGTLYVSGDITGSGTIDNQGTLNAGGNVTIGVTVNNSGQVATSGALSLAGGGTHTGSFTVTTPGNLAFGSGTHSMSGGGSIGGTGTLTFSGATATVGVPVNVGALNITAGTATLDANGSADAFTMTAGTLGGSGTLTLTNGGTWSGGTMSGSGTTVNPATMSLGISAPVTLSGRTLQNDGTLDVSGDITGSGTIDNGGTLNVLADLTLGVTVNNSGQVVTSNALSLSGGGTHTGSFDVTAPGNIAFSAGTHSMSGGGSITGTGALTFNGATATVGVPVNAGALSVSAGTATLNANGSADAFTMNGGTLGGSGILTLNNGGTWSGGTWFGGTTPGSGTTINPATKTLSISAPVTLNSRTLQNNGTLSVNGNVLGSGTIDNQGTLNAGANITIDPAVNNNGQIATSTLLSLGGNGAHSGTFTVTAPGVIDFSGGTQTISGTLAGTGTLRFSGAAATVSGTWTGMPIEVAGGSAALDTNGTIPALMLSGGTLTGSGDITVSGPSTWSGGTIAGSGDFTFDTGATVAMPGTNPVTLSRGLLNKGTINFTAVSNGMLIDGARFRNNGTFDIQSSQTIAATAGTPSFLNSGTLAKSSGEGVMQFGAPLLNSGLVRIDTGTMQFGDTYAQSAGKTSVLSSAKLKAATISLDGGSLTGNGTVAGTVANHATVSPGASPGTLTVSGDYVQASDGTLEIQLDGTAPGTQYDRLLVSGSVTLGGTLDVTTSNGFTPTAGNAFQILTFGSRTGNSTFAVMNGLNGLLPTFSANDLQLVSTVITPVAADVAVGVNGPGSTIAGTKVIYTVTVSNSGPDTATNVAVTATASPGLTFSANSGACVGSFPCNIATLGPGQSATIHSAWDIAPSVTGSVQLTVNASALADPNSSNNSDSAATNIGTCPDITIVAPSEMTTGLTAEATATGFGGAAYHWSIVNGTISRGDGTAGIEFIAGEPGTTTLAVNVTSGGCSLSATFDVTVKDRCLGTAMPTAPADAVIADAVVDFAWSVVDDASGYRLWLQQDGAPAQNLGTALGTSRTKIIPPGTYQWYVETLFDGCASHESERRTLTILPAQDCPSREKPQLTAPANEIPATSSAVAFSWNAVPQALEYELWLALAGGVPTLIHTTSDTFYTAVVPPGRLEWYVRAIFAGCAATESAHRVFTYTPPPECTSERPLRIAPVEGERLTSPVSFEWTPVSGATSYELYVDGELAATTNSPHASDVALPRAERRWRVRARLGENCGAVDSAESRLVVIAPSPSCAPLGSPVLSAPAQISSGTAGRIQWTFVAGATAYEVEISGDPQFPREATSSSTVTARQLPITFTNLGSAPVERYVRVHAVDTNCVQPGRGAFSPVAVVSVLPPAGSVTGNEGVALLTDPTDVQYTLSVGAELAGQSFTATPTVPWLSVTPASGIVPPGGQTLRAVAHTAGLPAGTSTGNVEITTTAPAGALRALATTPPVKLTISLNNLPGTSTSAKSTPPPDALVFPAVASVKNFVVRYDSDIHVTNTSAKDMSYEINFVPTGPAGMKEGKKTNIDLKPGATMPVRDIVKTWFGGRTTMTGTLEVRPLTETDTSTSSAPVGGLARRITFASSRTFSTTAAGGTYGQYIPAVVYANFIGQGRTLSLQHIAQSDNKYRTNLGLVEGSGEEVLLEVRIFDADGEELASFPEVLNGGERKQLDSVLSKHGLKLDDGRIEVEVKSGDGKVTAYASVLDSMTNDPQFVPPVTLGQAGHSKWIVPGVADLVSDSGNWQTDVRIFNAGTEPADLTLAFYSMNGGPPTTGTIQLPAGKVHKLDQVLSFFTIAGDAGALHISSAAPAQIVATARTYKKTLGGDYGQFIAALTPDDAVADGTRPLQILQMEESKDFKSNIGFAEVSGKPVTLEVTVFRPNFPDQSVPLKLEPNQFLQLNLKSLFASLKLGDLYDARISVSAVAGEGRALAYGSLIDLTTGDPTYIPGQ